jgi:hypothetical protein
MRKWMVVVCLSLLTLNVAAGEMLAEGPFAGVDLSALPTDEAQIIRAANEDFICVVHGRKPVNAKFDKSAPLPADGGTTFYKGKGYSLTIVQSLSSFGKLNGFIYGPLITFESEFAPGNVNKISSLRFYPIKQLNTLKQHADACEKKKERP